MRPAASYLFNRSVDFDRMVVGADEEPARPAAPPAHGRLREDVNELSSLCGDPSDRRPAIDGRCPCGELSMGSMCAECRPFGFMVSSGTALGGRSALLSRLAPTNRCARCHAMRLSLRESAGTLTI
eukprot:2632195-Prymnesium_polylepis.3